MHVNIVNTMVFTKITMVMTLVCVVQVDHTETVGNCLKWTTCTKCIHSNRGDGEERNYVSACFWSTERQECLQNVTTETATTAPSSLHDHADCPQLRVVDGGQAVAGVPYSFKVNVINDKMAHFVSNLSHVNITCLTGNDTQVKGRVQELSGDGGQIICDPVDSNIGVKLFVIIFEPNNVTLRLDREEDYYVTFHNKANCNMTNVNKNCVECVWTTGDYMYYVKRCSGQDQCLGRLEYYSRLNMKGANASVISRWENNVPTECDRVITIESFEPNETIWSGTESGEVKVSVRVKNHRILADGVQVSVAVGKYACNNPTTSAVDEDLLTCTVSTAAAQPAHDRFEGSVQVTYAGEKNLTARAKENVRFFVPKSYKLNGATCGPIGGGIELSVDGNGFVDNPSFRVLIKWDDGTVMPCRVDRIVDHGSLDFTTPAMAAPKGPGRVYVQFDDRVSVSVENGTFEFVDFSRPTAVGQRLSGIASGGTSVAVRWDGLARLWRPCVSDVHFNLPERNATLLEYRTAGGVFEFRSPAFVDGTGGERDGAGDGQTTDGSPIAVLACGFDVTVTGSGDRGGDSIAVPCPESGYAVYADPGFADFEVDGDGNVVIYGTGPLGLGFGVSDVTVEFRDKSAGRCGVLTVGRDRVVCAADRRTRARLAAGDGDLNKVLIKVGGAAGITVARRERTDVVRHRLDRVTKAWLLLPLVGCVVPLWRWRKRTATSRGFDAVRLINLSDEH